MENLLRRRQPEPDYLDAPRVRAHEPQHCTARTVDNKPLVGLTQTIPTEKQGGQLKFGKKHIKQECNYTRS